VSGVLLSQARLLLQAGFSVTIAAREPGSDRSAVPEGARLVEIDGEDLAAQLAQWAELCRQHEIDLVIDHQWLYTRKWPAFALAARAEGAGTIAWAHNFAARPILLGLKRLEFQTRHMDALKGLIVLSPLDVAFWKLRGMPRVAYLPNPPSPLLVDSSAIPKPKTPPAGRRIELVWWGRLEQKTKRVHEFVAVAAHLQRLGVDFRLRVIGPDWSDMSAAELNALAVEHSVAERVEALGPLYGEDLVAAIDSSDLFVNTSVIEGYPLSFPEAQTRGLPIAMYELPWLAIAKGNEGIVSAPQGDAPGLAARIAEIAADPALYARLSAASLTAAQRELSYDFAKLYRQLVSGTLSAEFSPEPTVEDVQQLIDLVILFSEQYAATRTKPTADRPIRVEAPAHDEQDSFFASAVKRAAPAVRTLLDVAPWLRPAAFRVKHALLRR
jgi:glycosyltransferase involved in cell wall biosynthesis